MVTLFTDLCRVSLPHTETVVDINYHYSAELFYFGFCSVHSYRSYAHHPHTPPQVSTACTAACRVDSEGSECVCVSVDEKVWFDSLIDRLVTQRTHVRGPYIGIRVII